MPSIQLSGLSKTYPNGAVALHPLDLWIPAAECLAIVGPSGAGKSTLLRLIAGLETASAGTIAIDGKSTAALEPHERGVALLSQHAALFPHLDAAENMALGRSFDEKRKPRDKRLSRANLNDLVRQTAETLGIADLLKRRPDELSGGEHQRVALGRAMVRGVKIWLLDEPLARLDPPLRRKLCDDLLLLKAHLSPTIMLVTHEPDVAKSLSDRVGVLEAGRLKVFSPDDALVSSGQPSVAFSFDRVRGEQA